MRSPVNGRLDACNANNCRCLRRGPLKYAVKLNTEFQRQTSDAYDIVGWHTEAFAQRACRQQLTEWWSNCEVRIHGGHKLYSASEKFLSPQYTKYWLQKSGYMFVIIYVILQYGLLIVSAIYIWSTLSIYAVMPITSAVRLRQRFLGSTFPVELTHLPAF